MIKAILFDMDGTLLPIDMPTYVPRQLEDMARCVFPNRPAEEIVEIHLKAMQAMMHQGDGRHPATPNKVIFEREMEALLKESYAPYRDIVEEYFDTEIHKFAADHPAHPEAMESVHLALEQGMRCVLATNPVFHRKHTRARIDWGKLDLNCFAFYTVMEDSWTTKPHTAYILEVVEKLGGVLPEECAFVGNDQREDMVPAHALGMKTFYLNLMPARSRVAPCWDAEGGFGELKEFIRTLNA